MPSLGKLLKDLGATAMSPGESLRFARRKLGMTLKEVEEVTGIKEPHLSALENEKIEMTRHYAEIFGAAMALHPAFFLYPNGQFKKSEDLKAIERRGRKYLLRAQDQMPRKKSGR